MALPKPKQRIGKLGEAPFEVLRPASRKTGEAFFRDAHFVSTFLQGMPPRHVPLEPRRLPPGQKKEKQNIIPFRHERGDSLGFLPSPRRAARRRSQPPRLPPAKLRLLHPPSPPAFSHPGRLPPRSSASSIPRCSVPIRRPISAPFPASSSSSVRPRLSCPISARGLGALRS